ncbi:MAG TPA: alpha/beta hydrolase [candidate division Zixibacteria bacterium]|nr:alpha/beta hydrolase [candidate division Zixibacteria bacterium]
MRRGVEIAAAGLVALAALGCSLEERFIFFPYAEISETPSRYGVSFEDVYFRTEDGLTLNGWFAPYPRASVTLLWFHGNAGNIGHRSEQLKLLHDRIRTHIFIFDYRGYGRSEGSPSEEGTYRDAAAALGHLRSRMEVDPERIVFFGQSLGAAVATELAARESCMALILEAPFTSIRDMAEAALPLLPIGSLLRTRYETVRRIREVRAPVLVLHGELDEVVPFAQGRRVFEAAPEPKTFHAIRGSRHNDAYVTGGEAYLASLKDFIDRAEARTGGTRKK